MKSDHLDTGASTWRTLFEERHGPDAYERLLADLRQPCVTFAAIAQRLGVTRERVRQWQMALLPDAPRGHARQRLCASYQRKRLLLRDPLVRAFYRHARAYVESGRVEFITATAGYRRRMVRIDRRIVALRSARPRVQGAEASGVSEYRLAAYRGEADFVYYRLAADEYLLMPAQHLRAREARFVDASGSSYREFKNTFAALDAGTVRHDAAAIEWRC